MGQILKKNKISKINKKSAYNFLNIAIIKLLNIFSKVFVVGYLIRTLGDLNYGVLTWVDSIIQYFIIFINFGFDLYAAKYIVETENNQYKKNQIISSIYYIKSFIFFVSFILMSLMTFNQQIYIYKDLLFLMLLFAIGEILNPLWYFQGVEKMHKITVTTTIGKVLLLLATLFFIKKQNDTIYYILFLVSINALTGYVGYYLMKKDCNFKFIRVPIGNLKKYFKESYLFFLGRMSMFTFNLGTVFLIGYSFQKELVSIYDISIKIIFIFIIPYEVLQQALFPILVKGTSNKVIKNLILFTLLSSVIITISILLFSKHLLILFAGNELLNNLYVLKILTFLIIPVSLSLIYANTIMVAKGFFKEFNSTLIISSIFYIGSLAALYFTNNWSFVNVIVARVVADIFLIGIRMYICRKKIYNEKYT
ncbi:O-antigen/teichoic acid export membrane protein [Flavobacterium croceum DSM 17960]|uniref:O-antigen/teichoic acid export membrane protein n=1 Tax=Flavobacterium croceum DSM 17960 TaxID=1121886 RepID=A0A2S4NB90_9FLAO|nr:oligosaccharide flippase family protein [Flavobacterium croceum]POS02976.1 O-antigen/teichoic acid export membrane protein [Flavobacterium croceum DSM 17960]